MKLVYQLSWADYSEAIKAALTVRSIPASALTEKTGSAVLKVGSSPRTGGGWRRLRTLAGWLAVIAALVLVLVVFRGKDPGRAAAPAPAKPATVGHLMARWAPTVCVGVMFAAFLYYRLGHTKRVMKRVRRQIESDPAYGQEYTVEIGEAGIRIGVGEGTGELDWFSIRQAVETPNLYLLYYGQEFLILPKRAFASVEEAEGFKTLVEGRIGERKEGAFPVLQGKERGEG